MIVYVESNFVLELALLQEEHDACTKLVNLSKRRRIQLAIPAFSLAEPIETLTRRHRQRRELQRSLSAEIAQLKRSRSYEARASAMSEVASLLVESEEEERTRLEATRKKLLSSAEVIPLTMEVLHQAASLQSRHGLSAQDAMVFASVRNHLAIGSRAGACFLNKNTKDFDVPDIRDDLTKLGCKLVPTFGHGLAFVKSQLGETTGR